MMNRAIEIYGLLVKWMSQARSWKLAAAVYDHNRREKWGHTIRRSVGEVDGSIPLHLVAVMMTRQQIRGVSDDALSVEDAVVRAEPSQGVLVA